MISGEVHRLTLLQLKNTLFCFIANKPVGNALRVYFLAVLRNLRESFKSVVKKDVVTKG